MYILCYIEVIGIPHGVNYIHPYTYRSLLLFNKQTKHTNITKHTYKYRNNERYNNKYSIRILNAINFYISRDRNDKT